MQWALCREVVSMATMMLTRPRVDNDAIAPVSAPTTYVLQPTPEHAEQVYLHLSEWLTWLRACRAQELVVDLSRARRLDFTAFGVFLAKVRDVLGIPVVITGAAAHLAHSLRARPARGRRNRDDATSEGAAPSRQSCHRNTATCRGLNGKIRNG
jgi:hypothetical protein